MEKESTSAIYGMLSELGIEYKSIKHAPANSMEACVVIGEQLGAQFCKNLFLANRQQTEFYLLLIFEDKKFRTADVSKMLGTARLSFGNEDALFEYLGTRGGSISPMGLIFDCGKKVTLLIDRDISKHQKFCVHPCDNSESLVINTDDFLNIFLRKTGHEPIYLTIAQSIPEGAGNDE